MGSVWSGYRGSAGTGAVADAASARGYNLRAAHADTGPSHAYSYPGPPDIRAPGGGVSHATAECGADVVGIDWRLSLSDARRILGPDTAVQGNLDPAALFAPREELASHIDRVLADAGPAPGHIFNLGHGIEKATDPDAVAFLVDRVHEVSAGA